MIIGNHIIKLGEIPSTNYYANSGMEQEMFPDGTVIQAKFQTRGKGLGSNTWYSSMDQNLTVSIVIYPTYIKAEDQFLLNQIVSLAVCDTVNLVLEGTEVYIKWPNDIIASGAKISGILIQNNVFGNDISFSIGIGLNVNEERFPEDIPNPVSIKQITGIMHDPDDVLKTLISRMNYWLLETLEGNIEFIKNEYLSNLYRYRIPGHYLVQ